MAEEQHEHHEHHVHHEHKGIKISKLLIFQATTVVLAIALVAMFALTYGKISTGITTDNSQIGTQTVEYLNANFNTNAVLKTTENVAGVYKVTVDLNGEETAVYVSPDGAMIFPMAINKTEVAEQKAQQPEDTTVQQAEMTKSSKPVVELFVMSHCPYGTQIEKGMIPVVELLGDKIDFTVKFVNYAMHGQTEINEELNQYCIQKEFNSKYLDYLKCFLSEGKTADCITSVGLDQTKLDTCIAATDKTYNVTNMFNDKSTWSNGQFPRFMVYNAENVKYGVQGSPTLVVNGAQAQAGRDSASLLSAVCNAFDTAPSECQQTLSSASPSPGFGYEASASGSGTAATCG
jgi:hypothetical protein